MGAEVGQMHLEIDHHWILGSENVNKREQMITQMALMSPTELQAARHSLETWSRLWLDHLDMITKQEQSALLLQHVRGFLGD